MDTRLTGFAARHIGSQPKDVTEMLKILGLSSLDELIAQTVPESIRLTQPLDLPFAKTEYMALDDLEKIASKNQIFRSFIGMGFSNTVTPSVILRNILENPGWYTSYTPYQAEISQGRMEALLNFQTMISDLTAMDIANASLLDESTAAAEAMVMCHGAAKAGDTFFVADDCHPQTIALLQTRAEPLGLHLHIGKISDLGQCTASLFGAIAQYPATDGKIHDLSEFVAQIHAKGGLAVVAADLLSLTLLKAPGEFGADIVVGSAQRFGVPLGYGGPHAGFMATLDAHKRRMPGRLIGVSRDSHGKPALRLTLQTREQHIRRDKATSNICTAQALLAIMASMYAVYHGPEGLRHIASTIHEKTQALARGIRERGWAVDSKPFFDTICVHLGSTSSAEIQKKAEAEQMNLRILDAHTVTISLDETTDDIADILHIFESNLSPATPKETTPDSVIPESLYRTSTYLTHPVFHRYHTETELMRYIRRLEAKDISLTTSMIPLGSCTMKLNAASEMLPVTWKAFSQLHPFAPKAQAAGYQILFQQLEDWLSRITGFHATSLQPNAGSQGEYAGLLVIRRYLADQGQTQRNVCLIPTSAHGTNPASAVMAGMEVVAVKCDDQGNIDLADLRQKAEAHRDRLATLMVTYPSTHGVFEEGIREMCQIIHDHGGQVYMDGANMNAQVGLCSPGDIGADVCHLNLHKTFCIPHGGGGPGIGPICVAKHLTPYLPSHPLISTGGDKGIGPVAESPWGSAGILSISWMFIAMMGGKGLTTATIYAILHANYIADRLQSFFPVLYRGKSGRVAHECILDLREWKQRAGVEVEDVAKRLMDFGFHAPTMSWPVPGTLMVEPTESESKEEIDRFCDAMIAIHGELLAIENGEIDLLDNPLKNAPHTALAVSADDWTHAYSRTQAAYPAPWLHIHKYWPPIGRVDNVYGDRHIFCTCPPVEER